MTPTQPQEPKAPARASAVACESINPDPLFDTTQAAAYLHSSEASLERYRALGVGPRWVKMSGIVRYRRSDLDAYILDCTRQPRRFGRKLKPVAARAAPPADAR